MSVVRYVSAVILIVIAAAALVSCGGDGKKANLLAPGEYNLAVSGTLEIEFQDESASAAPIGALQTHTADISGDVTLKMDDDGSFTLEQWGISGKVDVNGDTVTVTATDSPKEPSTGKTDSSGTTTDTYWKADTANRQTYVGYNDTTIGMSSEDPLTPNTKSFSQQTGDNTNVPFKDDAGKTFLILRGARLNFNLPGGQTPQATATPTPQPTTQPTPTPAPGSQTPQVRTEQEIKCQHTQPGVKSDLFDLILIYLKEAFPATPESGNYNVPDSPPRVVMAVANGLALSALPAPSVGANEEPLAGATVNVSVQGPGVLDDKVSGVTDASGQVSLRAGINKFGVYNMTIDSVVGADGTAYGFDQNSILSLTYEVGPVCELTPTPSP